MEENKEERKEHVSYQKSMGLKELVEELKAKNPEKAVEY